MLRALACLLLGVGTTSVVAWGSAALPRSRGFTRHAYTVDQTGDPWPAVSIEEVRRPGLCLREWTMRGLRTGYFDSIEGDLSDPPPIPETVPAPKWGKIVRGTTYALAWRQAQVAVGWPRLCFWCDLDVKYATGTSSTVHGRGGFLLTDPTVIREDLSETRILPVRPIWSALAANAAFYTLAWAMPLLAVSLVRRAVRRRRSLCPTCAYDRRGLSPATAPCPECGEAIASAKR